MKIIIEAEAKEIADLVSALQGQRNNERLFKHAVVESGGHQFREGSVHRCNDPSFGSFIDPNYSGGAG